MLHFYDDFSSIDLPKLPDGQYYIYVIENSPSGNIKIGRSSNIQQRFRSLSGSNGGGNHIVRACVTDATYLYTLERILHDHYDKMRISGTEWFDGSKLTFDEVVLFLNDLLISSSYERCNEIRKNCNERQKSSGYDIQRPKSSDDDE